MRVLRSIGVLTLMFVCSFALGFQTDDQTSPTELVTGSGDSLQIHINAVAVDESGKTIEDAQFKCALKSRLGTDPLSVEQDGDGRFRISIPCDLGWIWSIDVSCQSADGSQIGFQSISAREIHHFASNGLKLVLVKRNDTSKVRNVAVHVVDENGPVPGASVKAVVQSGNELTAVADENGVATVSLFSPDKLIQLTVWEGESRIGGFMLTRQPAPDPSLNEYTVKLNKSRPTKVRLIDVGFLPTYFRGRPTATTSTIRNG